MADHDVSKMKVADLKRELKNRGLNVTGNKNDLVERLQSALIEGDVFDDTAISEELLDDNDDVLNDDELDEETKSFLNSTAQDEDAILSSPKGSTSSKSPENPPESSKSATSAPAQAKKIVLKRKLLPSVSLTENDSPKPTTENKVLKLSSDGDSDGNADKDSNGNNDSNVVKLSELTMKERMELRAKKFGAAPTGDAAKLARAERFGITTNTAPTTKTDSKNGSLTIIKTAPDVELLKKRAERFGGSVSNTMVTIEQKEKLLKRQERFGAASTAVSGTEKTTMTTNPSTTQAASDYAEKAKLRLERFKTTA
ncbi:SAP domain-containing ribonucleoprotein-like [Sitodiplosis mosellana]|uniref:SAP domain-containing ribonucleoprotein-like n=1 Tax=Sitodiplosis mosellana TaxID=263140 RepID=UPI002443B84F|nr:SAP domain-containing ribonucleoprotein-like [Sitodiplosis mosellana]